jgi:hypothetical protein
MYERQYENGGKKWERAEEDFIQERFFVNRKCVTAESLWPGQQSAARFPQSVRARVHEEEAKTLCLETAARRHLGGYSAQ